MSIIAKKNESHLENNGHEMLQNSVFQGVSVFFCKMYSANFTLIPDM